MTEKQDRTRRKRREQLRARSPNDPSRTRNGQFKTGAYKGGPGRPKGAHLKINIEHRYAEAPTELDYAVVLAGLKPILSQALQEMGTGREPNLSDIPEFEQNQQLQIWAFEIRAKFGSTEHAKELLDRISPKPSRLSLEATVQERPAMGYTGTTDSEAEQYHNSLKPTTH